MRIYNYKKRTARRVAVENDKEQVDPFSRSAVSAAHWDALEKSV